MEKTFSIKVANSSKEWVEVLEQWLLQRITDSLSVRRTWQIEDLAEAGQVGWAGEAREGTTRWTLWLTVPAEAADSPPPPVIEWRLVAGVSPIVSGRRLQLPFAAIMVGTIALFAALGIHWRLPLHWIVLLATAGGIAGAFVGFFALLPFAGRPHPEPVAGGDEFLKDVASAVEKLRTEP